MGYRANFQNEQIFVAVLLKQSSRSVFEKYLLSEALMYWLSIDFKRNSADGNSIKKFVWGVFDFAAFMLEEFH